jgi:putative CocE/NonD family hydrolase
MQWGLRIPLRDGIHLSATLYLPKNSTPAPAICTLTPYVGQTYHDRGLYFAEHGYPFVTVDVRGRGNSEGTFQPLVNEADDAFDVVEWIARQAFCSGKVAMWGGSYGGYTQWAAAKELPPHLATLVPVASPYVGYDFPLHFNVQLPYWMQWLTLVSGRTSQDRMFWNSERYWGAKFRQWLESGTPFRNFDAEAGNPSAIFQEWASHPRRDDYWDRCNPTSSQYAAIKYPILTITGMYDANQPGALMHYWQHMENASAAARAQHYLVIGPWDHAGTRTPAREFAGVSIGPAGMLDIPKLHRQWYAWTMLGGPQPEFLRKRVAYFVMVAETWRYADTIEEITAATQTWHLHSTCNPTDIFKSGTLAPEICSRSEPDHYIYDPRDTALAGLESTVDPENRSDHRMVYASVGRRLVYHSAPFDRDIDVAGFFRLFVWIAIDQRDTDVCAAIYEVGGDGAAIELTTAWMRARYREDLYREQLVTTAEPLQYRFDRFMFVARRIRRGHRLRLVIGPIDSIYAQRNYNSGGIIADESMSDARTVTVKLFHDDAHRSALYVPLASAGE